MLRFNVSLTLAVFIFLSLPVIGQNSDSTLFWYNELPACPCINPDLDTVKLDDGWAKDKGNFSKYHKGASASYRSYPVTKTKYGRLGQQCCYDSSGLLITGGQGAGTPDKVGTCRGENKKGFMKIRIWGLWGHFFKDVKPWNKYMKKDPEGWKKYNALWVPNKGNNCE